MKRKLVQMSAFYRNDRYDGVGLTLTSDFGDLDHVLFHITTSYDLMYREAIQKGDLRRLIRDLFKQLDAIGIEPKTKKPDNIDLVIVFGNVYLLEKYKFLRGDEYNGLQLAYME